MNKTTLRLNAILLLLPLCVLSLLNYFNPHKPTISVLENRTLKAKPAFSTEALFTGQYFRDYEEYFADTFIFRDNLVQVSKRISELWSIDRNAASLVMHTGSNTADVVAPEPEEEQKPDEPVIHAEVDTSKALLVFNGRALELHTFSEYYANYYADFINDFSLRVGDKATVYSMLVPTQVEFLPNQRYRSLSSPQKHTIDYIYSQLNKQVVPVNAYDAIKQHSDEYVYFATDHHWTALGAYYAYTVLMKSQGAEPIPLERYESAYAEPFLGYLYSICLNESVKNNPDTVHYYKPFTSHTYHYFTSQGQVAANVIEMYWAQQQNKYGIFLGGDRPLGVIKTEITNGKKIAVVKDSFGNAFVPFLLPHYQEIYVIDPRQFTRDLPTFMADNGIQEALFLNYVRVTEHPAFTDLLRGMLK